MEVKGKIVEIFQTQQIKDTFKKREFVLEIAENPQYPEYVKFEFIQDKCGLLDSYKPGADVNVSFNLKGRKWTDSKGEVKYFNTLQAWRLQNATSEQAGSQTSPPDRDGMDQMDEPGWLNESEKTDDLPF